MKQTRRTKSLPRRHLRGLSLVELMVGLTVGLIVVAATTGLYLSQSRGSSRLMIEARLHQELRQAMDLVVNDVRRAGYWGNALQATQAGSGLRTNPYAQIDQVSEQDANTLLTYSFNSGEATEQYGFKVDNGVLLMLSAGGFWRKLTDADLVVIEDFSGTVTNTAVPVPGACRSGCTGPGCPQVLVTRVDIRLTGRAARDGSVRRTLTAAVRPRNERWIGACPT